MITPKQLAHKVRIIVKGLFAQKGVVGPHISKKQWDAQFEEGFWDRLANEDQKEHYKQIIQIYLKCGGDRSILDLGCGEGLLYEYFSCLDGFKDENYFGIDISEVAIQKAKRSYPNGNFAVIDYQNETIAKKFDTVIFNETLYYFNNAERTIKHCLNTNVAEGGNVIISMCDYIRHDHIWSAIEKDI